MQLVDEEDDLALAALHFLDGGFEPLFELAAEAGARQHGAQVQRDDALAHQRFGHVVGDDALGQPFDDGRLADARFADQDRVVFGAATKNLEHAQDFGVAPDDRVELALTGCGRQVLAVFFEDAILAFGVRFGDARAVAQLGDGLVELLFDDAGLAQNVGAGRVALAGDAEEEVLGADEVVVELLGFLVGDVHHALEARGDEDLRHRRARIGRRAHGWTVF